MHQRRYLSVFFVAVFLTAGVLVRPPSAAAAGQTGPGFKEGLLIGQATDPGTEKIGPKLSPLALRLYGGISQAKAGDINTGLDGYFEVFELYAAHGFGTTTGGYNALRDGADFGADLVFQITPRIGVGIGAGYMRFSESSSMSWTFGPPEEGMGFSTAPTLSAFPIRVGVFLSLPLVGEKLRLTLGAGAAAYAEIKLQAKERLETSDSWLETSLTARGGSPFDNVGYDGSLGLELRISPRIGLFAEAVGRYARLESFEKAAWSGRNDAGDSEAVEGRLYLEAYTSGEWSYDIFTVEETPPVSDSPNLVYKAPKIDLSGVSLRAGFRFRL